MRLACSHEKEHVVTDVDWTPGEPPKVVTVERAEELRAEMEEDGAPEPATTAKE